MLPDEKPLTSPAEAVVEVYEILKGFDETSRQRIMASVMSLFGESSGPLLPPASNESTSSKRPLSPAELVLVKEPATNTQRIICFAYYREKYDNQNYFARDDLKPYFSKAKLPAPANYDRDFTDAVKLGWIYENGDESYLTSKGLAAVEAGFGGKAAPRRRSVKSKSQKTQKKESSSNQ